jgi:hypothetical protein
MQLFFGSEEVLNKGKLLIISENAQNQIHNIFFTFHIFRALQIVQREEYLTAADTSIIRRNGNTDFYGIKSN